MLLSYYSILCPLFPTFCLIFVHRFSFVLRILWKPSNRANGNLGRWWKYGNMGSPTRVLGMYILMSRRESTSTTCTGTTTRYAWNVAVRVWDSWTMRIFAIYRLLHNIITKKRYQNGKRSPFQSRFFSRGRLFFVPRFRAVMIITQTQAVIIESQEYDEAAAVSLMASIDASSSIANLSWMGHAVVII